MTHRHFTFFVSVLTVACAILSACAQAAPFSGATPARATTLKHRWFFLGTNFMPDENRARDAALLRRAKAAGYNGVALTDVKFSFLGRMPASYFRNMGAFKELATQLGIDVYPFVCNYGYEGGPEAEDPQLAEGLPVRDATYIIKNGAAQIVPHLGAALQNGDFEASQGDRFSAWNALDAVGQKLFCDRSVKHGGKASLRLENLGTGTGNGRVVQSLAVAPWRQYHVSAWVKTQDFETPGNARTLVLSPEGKVLSFNNWHIERSQDWTHYDATFNSLGNSKVSVYFGVWGGRGGKIWWDDTRLEDGGFSNLLRRPGCPLKVQGDGVVYQEGRDFLPLSDPKTGQVPWPGSYDIYHEPPVLRLAPGSRIKEGQKLKISFYHVVVTDAHSVAFCPSEPKTYTLLLDQIKRLNEFWHPKGFFLGHDEIRQMNWCQACQQRKLTPGQLLADNVRRCVALARGVNPKAELYIWSDMFDPFHNAVNDYYLVNGSLTNSWEGVDKSVSIANWNFDSRAKSLPFFAARGYHQILAGYYDAGPDQIRSWLDAAKNSPNVDGVMYTTWANNYGDLEAFAKIAWGAGSGR